MGFDIIKTSNHGTSHPVVARMCMQTQQIIGFASQLDKKKQDEIFIYSMKLKEPLLRCWDIKDRLISEIKEHDITYQQNGVTKKSPPYHISLEQEVDNFLYSGKNFLRDKLGILNIFFGTSFKDARSWIDNTITNWAKKQFGEEGPLYTALLDNKGWIQELIYKRNASEHPDGYSGNLIIQNIQRNNQGELEEATWFRDKNKQNPHSILNDMEMYCDNMLRLFEDIILCGILHNTNFPISFYETPLENRTVECPVRFCAAINR